MTRFLIICSLLMLIPACSADTDYIVNQYIPEEIVYIDLMYEEAESYHNIDICQIKATLLEHEYILDVVPIFEYLDPDSVVIYRIRYTSDAYEVVGYVIAPADFMEQEYPILIFNRSGNREAGTIRLNNIIPLAQRGYVLLASQYRGVAGGTGTDQFGGDDINDVLRLIDISESFNFAQQGGVYMVGSSRGSKMTYIASRLDDRIVAATVWAGATNAFDTFYERELAMQRVYIDLVGGTPEELPEEFERRSPVMWANEIQAPFLIVHGGEADWRTPTHHAINMAEALERYGLPHRLVIYLDIGHDFDELHFMKFLDEMDEWFRMHPVGE